MKLYREIFGRAVEPRRVWVRFQAVKGQSSIFACVKKVRTCCYSGFVDTG